MARDFWAERGIALGEEQEIRIPLTRSYSGVSLELPIVVRRAAEPGPTVFISAAVHGDEINGTGVVQRLVVDPPFTLKRGTLLLIPVVNLLGFERHDRYLPDRRDLNRSFPGTPTGSLASRIAHVVTTEIIENCDYGIDIHTAAIRRTNFPNVRADLTDRRTAAFARGFGAELLLSGEGPDGSLRRAACERGCPTFVVEAGETWKVEPAILEFVTQGITNALIKLNMVEGERVLPSYRIETDTTNWVRAQEGGFLQFHVAPGDLVRRDQPLATNRALTGRVQNTIVSPVNGVVVGMTTMPSVAPGDPVVHLAYCRRGELLRVEKTLDELSDDSLYERLRGELATNVTVVDWHDDFVVEELPTDPS